MARLNKFSLLSHIDKNVSNTNNIVKYSKVTKQLR